MYALYLLCHANCQTHVYLIASSVRNIIKRVIAVYQFKSARMGFYVRLIYVFLGCDLPIQLQITWKGWHLPKINSEVLNNYFYTFLLYSDHLKGISFDSLLQIYS